MKKVFLFTLLLAVLFPLSVWAENYPIEAMYFGLLYPIMPIGCIKQEKSDRRGAIL